MRGRRRRQQLLRAAYQLTLISISLGGTWYLMAKYLPQIVNQRQQQNQVVHHDRRTPRHGPLLPSEDERTYQHEVAPRRDERQHPTPRVELERTPSVAPANSEAHVTAVHEESSKPYAEGVAEHSGDRGSFVLDLTGRYMNVPLDSAGLQGDLAVKLMSLEECAATTRFSPPGAVVSRGSPVDILFQDFPQVRIRVEIYRKTSLRVSPQIDVGRSEPVDFSEKRIKSAVQSLVRSVGKLQKSRSRVASELGSIQSWMNSVGAKDLSARNAAKNRAAALGRQLENLNGQLKALESNAQQLERIRGLGGELHDTASVVYRVSSEETLSNKIPTR